jgi:NCK-associated protein 1
MVGVECSAGRGTVVLQAHLCPVPKTKDKFTEDTIRDPHISELIYLNDQLSSLIRQHQRIIQAYYLEYLNGADLLSLKEQVNALPSNAPAAPLLKAIIAELSSISVDAFMNGQEYNFEALRLNWFRVECQLSQTSSTVTVSSVKELVHRGRLIVLHSKNVDMIEELIDQYASLKTLWYYRDHLLQAFEKSILEGPSNPLHVMSFLHLFGEFPENATPFLPQEKQEIGPYCVKLAEDLLNKVIHRIASVLFELGKYNLNFHNQLNHANAAHPLLQRIKDYKFDKNYVPPTTPGAESQYKNRKELDSLRLYERNVYQLCYALDSCPEVVVYDHHFTPREYLRDKLLEVMRRFVKKTVICDAQNHLIQRPSVLETRFQLFFSTMRTLENFVDVDVGEAIRHFLLTQVYNPALSEMNKIEWSVEGDLTWQTDTMMRFISKWYGEFVSKRLAVPGICYSMNRKAFISKAAMQFRAEEYCDLVELQALVRIIGPYGVKCIDREVMKHITSNIAGLREILTVNRKLLGEISMNYYKDVSAQIKALRDADTFIGRSISIGNALQFRQLLHEAQRQVAERDIPYITTSISFAFTQYPRNTFLKPEFLEMDALALSVGLDAGTADQALKAVLSKLLGEQDKDLWQLLPFMYAAGFVSSKPWGEAIYRSAVEAYANNAHTLSLCINALLVSIKATTSVAENEREIVDLLKKFIESSACILLRHAQLPQKALEKLGIQSLPSVVIFMDKFLQESPLLTQDMLEGCMPYALLRSLYRQIYESKAGKKSKGEGQEDAL